MSRSSGIYDICGCFGRLPELGRNPKRIFLSLFVRNLPKFFFKLLKFPGFSHKEAPKIEAPEDFCENKDRGTGAPPPAVPRHHHETVHSLRC